MCKHFLFLQFFSIKLCACSGSMINLLWNGMRNFMAPTNRRLTWMKTHRYKKKRNASDIKAMITIETWKRAFLHEHSIAMCMRANCVAITSQCYHFIYREKYHVEEMHMCASTRCTPTVHNWNSIPMMKTCN